jgi:hypothetical protein
MPLRWFSRKEVDELADSIVAELVQHFPQSGIDASTKKSAQQATRKFGRMLSRIGEFAAERRPNLYQKACFGNRVKWGLKEAGYPAPFIDVATREFVTQMALASRAAGLGRP